METAAVIPCFISSITAYTVFTQIFGTGLAINTPKGLQFGGAIEIPFYLVLAILCSLVGYLYVVVFYGLRDKLFRPLPMPVMLKPAVGGLMLGAIAIWLPQLMSGGYGWIQMAIDGKLTLWLMALLCLGKIFATSFTISSGGSGGVFAPSLFIGAMLGGAFGLACEEFFPGVIKHPEAFVLVGMGGLFAGIARVPLTAMLMVCEMSGSYNLLIPLMLVCMINMAMLSSRWTLYEQQVFGLVDSPAHHGDFVIDVLEQMHVRDVMDVKRKVDLIPEGMPLTEILRMASYSNNSYYPVVDEQQQLGGHLFLARSACRAHRRSGGFVDRCGRHRHAAGSHGQARRRFKYCTSAFHAKKHRLSADRRHRSTSQSDRYAEPTRCHCGLSQPHFGDPARRQELA